MELLYYWSEEDYPNFKNLKVHLSNRFLFDFSFDRQKAELKINKNPKFTPNFFGKHITNLTAIVGKNGAGKTNLLYSLISKLTGYDYPIGINYLIAFWDGSIISISHTLNNRYKDLSINVSTKDVQVQITPIVEEVGDIIGTQFPVNGIRAAKTEVIYFNPIYDFRDYPYRIEPRNFTDVSSTYLLWKDKEIVNAEEDDMAAIHRYKEIERQFQMTQSQFLKNVVEIDDISLPDKILVKILPTNVTPSIVRNLGFELGDIYKLISDYGSKTLQVCNDLIRKNRAEKNKKGLEKTLKEKAKIWLLINFFNHFIYCFSREYDLHDNSLKISKKDIEFFKKNTLNISTDHKKEDLPRMEINEFHKAISQFFKKQAHIRTSNLDINANISQLFQLIDEYAFVDEENSAEFNFDFNVGFKFLGICDRYAKVFNIKDASSISRITWRNLSSGEMGFLNLFARIFHGYKQLVNEDTEADKYPNLIYLIIDEGEHSFHPRWQKSFIKIITKYLSYFKGVQFQIFLASHSPIILSDIPSSNVVYLQKSNGQSSVVDNTTEQESFASNIHVLFKNTFFMDEGVIGDFAQKKIDEIYEKVDLVNSNTSYEDVQLLLNEIDIIGEPILKNTFKEKVISNADNAISIALLEQELERLKKKRGDNE